MSRAHKSTVVHVHTCSMSNSYSAIYMYVHASARAHTRTYAESLPRRRGERAHAPNTPREYSTLASSRPHLAAVGVRPRSGTLSPRLRRRLSYVHVRIHTHTHTSTRACMCACAPTSVLFIRLEEASLQ